jgi:hypothetical protein
VGHFALSSSIFSNVYSFTLPPPPEPIYIDPEAFSPLTPSGGLLYGELEAGGSFTCDLLYAKCGSIYSIDPASGAQQTVFNFNGLDGAVPEWGLLRDGTVLYGVGRDIVDSSDNYYGGALFKFDPATGQETVLHSFSTAGDASSALIRMSGLLYGTTYAGGMPVGGSGGTVTALILERGPKRSSTALLAARTARIRPGWLRIMACSMASQPRSERVKTVWTVFCTL